MTTDKLLAALQDLDPQIRVAAAGMLVESLNKGAVPAIMAALKNETYRSGDFMGQFSASPSSKASSGRVGSSVKVERRTRVLWLRWLLRLPDSETKSQPQRWHGCRQHRRRLRGLLGILGGRHRRGVRLGRTNSAIVSIANAHSSFMSVGSVTGSVQAKLPQQLARLNCPVEGFEPLNTQNSFSVSLSPAVTYMSTGDQPQLNGHRSAVGQHHKLAAENPGFEAQYNAELAKYGLQPDFCRGTASV